jgi:hypothetical protein
MRGFISPAQPSGWDENAIDLRDDLCQRVSRCLPLGYTHVRIRATRMSAMLTGIWTAIGLSVWAVKYSASLLFHIAALIFFVVPVVVLVVGLDYYSRWKNPFRSLNASHPMRRQFWSDEKEVWIRVVLSFLSGAVSGTLYSVFVIGK